MRKNIFIITIVLCLMFPGCFVSLLLARDPGTGTGAEMDFVEELGDEASMNWTTRALRVNGNGFGPENVKELGRRKILAKRAAMMDAYRNLIEVIKGVRITSYTSVEDMMVESDWVKAKAGGMVKGMQMKEVTYSNDGSCEVTVEVNIDKDGKFLLAALITGEVLVIDNYPKFDWAALQKKLKNVQIKFASLLAAFKKKGEKLVDARKKLAHMEERLKAADIRELELKAQLSSAEKELIKTKYIVNELNYRLINLEIELTKNEKELEMTKKFLSEKKKELDKLSAEFVKLKGDAIQDREKLLKYVLHIIKIQRETGKRLECVSKTKPDTLIENCPSNESDYTGLLVDARGLNLKPALAPSILSQNREKIYGIGAIPTEVNSGAIVDYLAGNIERAKKHKKIADRPLVVKGIEVVDKSDIIISNEDAQKLVLILNLLEQRKVAILH